MAIVLGIDKFMSECRAVTNFIGNGVATIVVSAWEGELDRDALARGLEPARRSLRRGGRRDDRVMGDQNPNDLCASSIAGKPAASIACVG